MADHPQVIEPGTRHIIVGIDDDGRSARIVDLIANLGNQLLAIIVFTKWQKQIYEQLLALVPLGSTLRFINPFEEMAAFNPEAPHPSQTVYVMDFDMAPEDVHKLTPLWARGRMYRAMFWSSRVYYAISRIVRLNATDVWCGDNMFPACRFFLAKDYDLDIPPEMLAKAIYTCTSTPKALASKDSFHVKGRWARRRGQPILVKNYNEPVLIVNK